ncbi:hypothetical protein LTR36_006673 [Oleoguttula mirabilis]|uniref:Rhodopsin domain-containing protein n=1 Tax=Oleoguttula mirabilis TaxID=1507867 RepID=A0AAV9JBV3_9PEZI|nr:hypothetical protein LTR36_006673 [Oleoguttula mirabilis]
MELHDKAPDVFAAVFVLGFVACIVFPLRVYVRLTKKIWGYDDWCMCIGFVPFLALTVICLGGSFHGIGVHQARLNDDEQSQGRLWFFLFEVFFCISIILVKLSIAFMLARIADPMRPYVYALWTASALVTVMNLGALFYIIFQCSPVAYFWDYSIKGGHCNPSRYLADMYYADTAVNITVDWFCALLPIPLLWNINMNVNTKISVAFLLGLGIFASLAACIRLKYTVNLNNSDDFLYSVGDIVIWGYAENATGIIVGCFSVLKPLFSRIFRLGGSNDRSSHELNEHRNSMPLPQSAHGGDNLHGWARTKQGKSSTVVKSGSRKNSGPSFCESEEELVQNQGIKVHRSVMQHRDFASKL